MPSMRLGMNSPSAQRQAVLRAIGEDNRALTAAAGPLLHRARRSRAKPARGLARLSSGRILSMAFLAVGVFVCSPAVTGVSAYRLETLPAVAEQHGGDGFSDRRVPTVTPDRIPDPWGAPSSQHGAFPPQTWLQENLPLPEYGPRYAPGDASPTLAAAVPMTVLF